MPLSEKELLLLDCFMYSDIAPRCKKGTSVSDIIDQFSNESGMVTADIIEKSNIALSGNVSAEELADVMNQMKQSTSIMNLKIMATTEEYTGSIRAACFVDSDTGKATVAFRGTGGSYKQWYNNFEGFGDVSQQSQEDAVTFINSLPYNDIDVTGHSNGGDQAMYATIVCGDKISRCVSFEGQGMSKEFFQEYSGEIARSKLKIKNISGKKDFVSPLMMYVAGEMVYVISDSELLGGVLNHGAYGILTANQEALDRNNGYFPESSYVEQAWYCKAIHYMTEILSFNSDNPSSGATLELIADFSGIIVGLSISKSWTNPEALLKASGDLLISLKNFAFSGIEECIFAIKSISNKVMEWFVSFMNYGAEYSFANPQIVVDTYKLDSYGQRLKTVNTRISRLDSRLDSLYWRVGLLDLWNLIQADIFIGYSWRLIRCANYLCDTAIDFTNVENELTSRAK